MDPIAHTLTAATLAATGLRRASPLATAVLLIGANAPDIDAASYFGEPFQSLAFRRGITHGLLALAIWPFLVAALVIGWDRCVRRKRSPGSPPARAGPLLALAAIAVLTHPALDWLNNYGMRWLMPFDGTWFYGDAVFIIDPWIWLGLGSIPFLIHSRARSALIAWCLFWVIALSLVLSVDGVPVAAKAVWITGLGVLLAVRFRPRRDPAARAAEPSGATEPPPQSLERAARVLVGLVVTYIGVLVVLDSAERSGVRAVFDDRGIAVERIMVAPVPANPFAGQVIVATPTEYHVGEWNWLGQPRLELTGESLARNEHDPLFEAAAATIEARRFLTWARFPYASIESNGAGYSVSFLDARYSTTGRLFGPTVELDGQSRPVTADGRVATSAAIAVNPDTRRR